MDIGSANSIKTKRGVVKLKVPSAPPHCRGQQAGKPGKRNWRRSGDGEREDWTVYCCRSGTGKES